MKIVKKTAEYSIYKKRNDRYAIKDSDGKWLNAEKKIAILQDENLIKLTQPSKPESEQINETEEPEVTEVTEEPESKKE